MAAHVLSEAEGKNLHVCLEDSSLTIIMTPIKIRLSTKCIHKSSAACAIPECGLCLHNVASELLLIKAL